MNTFMNGLTDATNYTVTENGALAHKTTRSDLLDLFAMGAAYRKRSDADVINLFKNAYNENPKYALKCLFYLRDVRGGQGERRFFRLCMHWLAANYPSVTDRLLKFVPEFGRWDDLYAFVNTPCEKEAFDVMKKQFALDLECQTPSLLAKWLKSENTSSKESRRLGTLTRHYFHMTSRQYRKTLSILRNKINVLERLMSENKWDEIEFDKIPSKAGMIYKNAFARHDIERQKNANVQSYEDFAKDKTKTVNAKTLYPYECVSEALKIYRNQRWNTVVDFEDTNRLMINKYWDNLTDYFNNASFNGIAVVDTSGSMTGFGSPSDPINVAISLGLYCAEHNSGPFANQYISFASKPQLIRTDGVDFVDKVERIYATNLIDNTNIEAVFDLMLYVALQPNTKKEDIPQNVIIISDMEFDEAINGWHSIRNGVTTENVDTLLESIAKKWKDYGLELPGLIFWNVDARQNNIPMIGNGRISYVSGFSPVIFETIMSGKTGYELMMEKLNSERYECIK